MSLFSDTEPELNKILYFDYAFNFCSATEQDVIYAIYVSRLWARGSKPLRFKCYAWPRPMVTSV